MSSLISLCLWKWTLVSNLSPSIMLAERNQREITTEVKKVFRRLMSWRETLREQFCSTFQASRLLPPRILKFFRTFWSKEKSSFLPDFKLATFHYYGIGRIELEIFIHLANTSCWFFFCDIFLFFFFSCPRQLNRLPCHSVSERLFISVLNRWHCLSLSHRLTDSVSDSPFDFSNNERQWKKTIKENEREWETMKDNERQWKRLVLGGNGSVGGGTGWYLVVLGQ